MGAADLGHVEANLVHEVVNPLEAGAHLVDRYHKAEEGMSGPVQGTGYRVCLFVCLFLLNFIHKPA